MTTALSLSTIVRARGSSGAKGRPGKVHAPWMIPLSSTLRRLPASRVWFRWKERGGLVPPSFAVRLSSGVKNWWVAAGSSRCSTLGDRHAAGRGLLYLCRTGHRRRDASLAGLDHSRRRRNRVRHDVLGGNLDNAWARWCSPFRRDSWRRLGHRDPGRWKGSMRKTKQSPLGEAYHRMEKCARALFYAA
jgi:hypothetical protein